MNIKSGKRLFTLFFICIAYKISAQLTILPVFGDKPITENTEFVSKNGDSIQFDNIRFYISNIQYEVPNDIFGSAYFNATKKAHLVDVFEPKTLKIEVRKINLKQVKSLHFNIGIDSLTNVSGALDGDLDPQRGMYWAWQSGYVNLKIEGRSPQCKNRKNVFQFHIGGYLPPFYALKHVELPLNSDNIERNEITKDFDTEGIILKMDMSKFFEKISIASQNSIMMPCKEAVQLADFSVQMFSIQAHEK